VVKYRVVVEGRTFEIEVGLGGRVWVDQCPLEVDLEGVDGLPHYSLLVNHRSYETHVESEGEECRVMVAGRPYRARLDVHGNASLTVQVDRSPSEDDLAEVAAPLPGRLVEVRVAEGQQVQEGQEMVVLESMKMHLKIRAPQSGLVTVLHACAGCQVAQGEVLAVIQDPSTSAHSQ